MEQSKRVCRRCLTKDMSEKEYFKYLHSYINNLEEDIKVEPNLYEIRLHICMECQWYLEGMCRTCGCFVEMRAVIEKQSCPYGYW